jgi:RHS repeat-associated protein
MWRERYTPFGEKMDDPAGNKDHMGYTGHIEDTASGLTYMQARYYDPVIGRFLSIDPVGFVESGNNPAMFNRYAYAWNDPVNLTDPDGKCPMCIGALISVGLEATIMAVEVAAGKEISAQEAAVRLGSSAVAGAAGVGIVTKVKSVGKVAGALKKVTLPAGNGNSIKAGNAAAGAFEGAVSGATSEVVGAELKQAGGVGDGASIGSVASAAATGGVMGGITGSASGNSVGDAVNNGVEPTVRDSVNTQMGILETGFDVISAPANVESEKHD